MSIFGWSYPPGAASDPYAPYNQTDEPIQLHEDKTLIGGIGRRGYGLNGKNADLDPGGQNVVESAWWTEDDVILVTGYRYASVCGSEDWTEAQWAIATEIVCGTYGYPGEWDGDYWVFTDVYALNVPCAWSDAESADENQLRAAQTAYEAIAKDSEAFEREMAGLVKTLETIGAEEE